VGGVEATVLGGEEERGSGQGGVMIPGEVLEVCVRGGKCRQHQTCWRTALAGWPVVGLLPSLPQTLFTDQ